MFTCNLDFLHKFRSILPRDLKPTDLSMSMLSDGTSDEETLEDVVLELMKGTGFLSQIKGDISKFLLDSGKINNQKLVIPERADGQVLTYIYEYLQWIGMKQTCAVLLSESPVKIDTSPSDDKSESEYRPTLHKVFLTSSTPPPDSQPRKSDSKISSIQQKSEEKVIPNSITKISPNTGIAAVKSFDDLMIASELEKSVKMRDQALNQDSTLETNNNDDKEVSNKSELGSKNAKSSKDLENTTILSNGKGNYDVDINEKKSPTKKSEASAEVEDASTSDLLSLDLEDEDTQDISIPSITQGMSQCDYALSI